MFEGRRSTSVLSHPKELVLVKYYRPRRPSEASSSAMGSAAPVTLQPTSLRVEATFPARAPEAELVSQLTSATALRLDEAQLPSCSSPSGVWDVRFHSGTGESVLWRWVDWEPFGGLCCCGRLCGGVQAGSFRAGLVVAGGGGEVALGRETRRCWPSHQGAALLLRDGAGVELGSVRHVRERYFVVLGVSGRPMMEVVEEEAGPLSANRVYTFLWAQEDLRLSRRRTVDVNAASNSCVLAKGTRKVRSKGLTLSQGLCGLHFQATAVPLDPLHKLLCLAALLYIQKLTFRRYVCG